mmetsp:Transcript_77718/g.215933  ORF Transcript_77718/g.215933 Transcript_77718/m.215933 type:complete len:118 (+) Transcript_77718:83-436(+)
MARSPILSVALVAVVACIGLRSAFVPSPAAAEALGGSRATPEQLLQSAAVASGAFLASSAPAFAGTPPAAALEEIDSAEVYNRKVLTGAAYGGMLCAFLFGLIISQARKLVENKWLN